MKYFIIIFLLWAAAAFTSCADNSTETVKAPGEAAQRIIGKEYTVYKGNGYQIIEIDGVEYVASTGGGICPLQPKK